MRLLKKKNFLNHNDIFSTTVYGYFLSRDEHLINIDVDVDVVDIRAQADASMPASNNNVNYTIYSNF